MGESFGGTVADLLGSKTATRQANKIVPQSQSTSCEGLGFIGGGILDSRELPCCSLKRSRNQSTSVTIRYIYEREPNSAPGGLTLLKVLFA